MGSGGGAQQAPDTEGEQRQNENAEEQPGKEAIAAGDQVDEADARRDEHAADEDYAADRRARTRKSDGSVSPPIAG